MPPPQPRHPHNPPPPTGWRDLRYRLEHAAVAGLARAVPHLDRAATLALARSLGSLAFRFDHRGRATALENLALVFPSWSAARRDEVALASYQNMARTALDLFWFPNLCQTPDAWRRWVRERWNIDPAVALDPTVAVTPHYGNFEWLALCWGFSHNPIRAVAQDFKNPYLTPLFQSLRGASGNEAIPRDRVAVRLLKHLKAGGQTALLSDLTLRPSRAATVIECFGRKACVTALHGLLASRTGLPVSTTYSLPHPDGTYTHVYGPAFETTGQSPQQVAQRCWDLFEPVVRERPEHWLWMYKFWRYLPADADPDHYPSYANRSKAFDRLARSLDDTG